MQIYLDNSATTMLSDAAKQKAAEQLCALLQEGDALLLKASRGMRLEEVYHIVKQHLSK